MKLGRSRLLSVRERIALHVLHAAAVVALWSKSPLEAKRIVQRLAARLGKRAEPSESAAIEAVRTLQRGGTCLTRAIAVAAWMPGTEIVIGVRRDASEKITSHAWLQMGERPLEDAAIVGGMREIAKIP